MDFRLSGHSLPAWAVSRIDEVKRHTEATGSDALDLSPVAPQVGGGNPLRMGIGKDGRAVKPGRVREEVRNSQTTTSHDWQAISASLRTIHRNKCAAAPQGSPTLAAHLFLVIDGGADHASSPTRRVAR